MSTVMVVCDIYKLLKDGKSFTKNGKQIKRTNAVQTREWAEQNNEKWSEIGLWYEIDEVKTLEYYEKGNAKRENKKKALGKKQQLTEVMSEILEKANEVVEIDDEELNKLKDEYQEKFGKKPFYKWGVEELTEKLK